MLFTGKPSVTHVKDPLHPGLDEYGVNPYCTGPHEYEIYPLQTHTHTHVHTHTRTCTHTYAQTYTHAHRQTHTLHKHTILYHHTKHTGTGGSITQIQMNTFFEKYVAYNSHNLRATHLNLPQEGAIVKATTAL